MGETGPSEKGTVLQFFGLARQNAALKHELGRVQGEAESLRLLLDVALLSRVEPTTDATAQRVVADQTAEQKSLSADESVVICIVCHQPLRRGESHCRTEDDAVGCLAEATANSPVEVSGSSLTRCACPMPVEPQRASDDASDGSIDQDHHEPSTCGCLICAVAGAGTTPNYTVLNPTPLESAVPTLDRLAFAAFCVARALVLGFGALLAVSVSATFVH